MLLGSTRTVLASVVRLWEAAGVPLELVQKVTGYKTTDIVLKHHFRPGPEDGRTPPRHFPAPS
jgi:hypothetical protein